MSHGPHLTSHHTLLTAFTLTFMSPLGKTHNHRSRGDNAFSINYRPPQLASVAHSIFDR